MGGNRRFYSDGGLSSYHEYSARTTDKKDVLYRTKRIEFNSINDSPSRFEYSGYSTKG